MAICPSSQPCLSTEHTGKAEIESIVSKVKQIWGALKALVKWKNKCSVHKMLAWSSNLETSCANFGRIIKCINIRIFDIRTGDPQPVFQNLSRPQNEESPKNNLFHKTDLIVVKLNYWTLAKSTACIAYLSQWYCTPATGTACIA